MMSLAVHLYMFSPARGIKGVHCSREAGFEGTGVSWMELHVCSYRMQLATTRFGMLKITVLGRSK